MQIDRDREKINMVGKGTIIAEVMNEDMKTAVAHMQRTLKKGEEVEVIEVVRNLYGSYYYVIASDGETFYVDPKNIIIKNLN